MEPKRINRNLCNFDLFPSYVKAANGIGFSGEVFLDEMPEGRKAIGTHSGMFHSDEALAVSMLRALPEFGDHVIIRTRDDNILKQCDIVVDVGGEYNPAIKRFDHHQKGFCETFDEFHKTKLSSAGLVFKHYGKDIISKLSSHSLDDDTRTMIWKLMYDTFVEEIDGVDNGIDAFSGDSNYKVTTTISKRVSRLAPAWNEPWSVELEQERFRLAMGMMLGEFAERLYGHVDILLPARNIVVEALNNAENIHPSKSVLLLEQDCPFMEHLSVIEKERGIEGQVKFVIAMSKDNSWRIRAINVEQGSFALRKQLLPKCLGMRSEELSRQSGIDDCVFVHISGFMGINKTKEGALAMAINSLYHCLLH